MISTLRVFLPIHQRMADLPEGSTVLLRRPRSDPPQWAETAIAAMAIQKIPADFPTLTVEWYAPTPGGRDQTYRRDFEFVESADEVIAYFDVGHPMEGGTGHVVEAALARGIPVAAWSIDETGRMDRVGEIDAVTY